MAKKASGKSFVLGAALGAAFGTVLAFFKTPRSGAENQALAREKVSDLKLRGKSVADDVSQRSKRVAKTVADNYVSTKNQAKKSGRVIKKSSGELLQRLKKDTKEVYREAKKETSGAIKSAKKKLSK